MRDHSKRPGAVQALFGLAVACVTASSVGCQVDVNGQTLPSPYYQKDDIYYAAPGPEMKVSREAAAQKAFREQVQQQQGPQGQLPPQP